MRFLMIYTPDDPVMRRHEAGEPPTPQEIAEMGTLMEEWTKKGVLLSAEGCMPSAKAARVRKSGKDYKATDGPFAEAKEVVGGLAVVKAGSRAEAVEWAKKFLAVAGDGETRIFQLYEDPAVSEK